ncbi:MAG: hypothetical protein ACRDF4_07710 [Rhabdochlamydiaceae bacterium]
MNPAKQEKNFPLFVVVLDDIGTYASAFSLSDTLANICGEALRNAWKEKKSQLSERKITDRYGKELSPYVKLQDTPNPTARQIFMSKKVPDLKEERLLVRVENRVEQRL